MAGIGASLGQLFHLGPTAPPLSEYLEGHSGDMFFFIWLG